MANKSIKDYSQQSLFTSADGILIQRGAAYYWVDADDILDHLDTDSLAEGSTNEYASTANLDTYLATKDSDDLTQGSTNKYATTSVLNAYLGTKTTANLTEYTAGVGYKYVNTATFVYNHADITGLFTTPQIIIPAQTADNDFDILSITAYHDNQGSTAFTSNALEVYVNDGSNTTLWTCPAAVIGGIVNNWGHFMPASTSGVSVKAGAYDVKLRVASADPTSGDAANFLKIKITYGVVDWTSVV